MDSYAIFDLVNATNLVHKFSFFPLHISVNCVPSSGEITVYMWHLVFVDLCGWLSGMTLHTRQSSTQTDKHQLSHIYSYFSWWWHTVARHCRENKHIKKNCAQSWLNLQYYIWMDGQQNRKIGNIWSLNSSSSAPSHTMQRAAIFIHIIS